MEDDVGSILVLVGVEMEEFLELATEVGLLVELGWLGCLAGVGH
jgi:hypothetical protein